MRTRGCCDGKLHPDTLYYPIETRQEGFSYPKTAEILCLRECCITVSQARAFHGPGCGVSGDVRNKTQFEAWNGMLAKENLSIFRGGPAFRTYGVVCFWVVVDSTVANPAAAGDPDPC